MVEAGSKNTSGTVLFVDDDRAMVNSTAQWLQLSGLNVKSFADPHAVLRSIKPKQNIIIISDIRMPEMNGIQLMDHVLKLDSDIPVLLITGHGDVPLAVEAMKRGAFEFLTKPFSPEKLLERACDALDQRAKALAPQPTKVEASEPATPMPEPVETNLTDQVDEYEKSLIESALKKHNGKVSNVLAELDIPRRTLNAKMQKYGINRKALN